MYLWHFMSVWLWVWCLTPCRIIEMRSGGNNNMSVLLFRLIQGSPRKQVQASSWHKAWKWWEKRVRREEHWKWERWTQVWISLLLLMVWFTMDLYFPYFSYHTVPFILHLVPPLWSSFQDSLDPFLLFLKLGKLKSCY